MDKVNSGEWTGEKVARMLSNQCVADAHNAALATKQQKTSQKEGAFMVASEANQQLREQLDAKQRLYELVRDENEKKQRQLDVAVEALKKVQPWLSVSDAKIIDAARAMIGEGKQ